MDDILGCGEDPRFMMECIEKRFTLKNGTIKEPDMYLGADIEKVFFHNGEDDSTKMRCVIFYQLHEASNRGGRART